MRRLSVILGFILLTASVGITQEIADLSPEVVKVSNEMIMGIYQDIIEVKSNYPELQSFDEDNLVLNDRGIYEIRYEYVDATTPKPYAIGITVNAVDDKPLNGPGGQFSEIFPKINAKITGYFQKHPIRTQFNVVPFIAKHGIHLAEYQQQFMPLRINVEPLKKAYKTRQDVSFKVTLRNVSNRHMIVRSLGKDTLFFRINNQIWGTSPLSEKRGGSTEVLKSGEEISIILKGESFLKPQELNVLCFYRMSIDGINPFGKTMIMIEE